MIKPITFQHPSYISASKPNKETGLFSYLHDVTAMSEFDGKANRELKANVYHGQRDVSVKAILAIAIGKTAGYTSKTEALLVGTYGQDVHKIRKSIQRNIRKAAKRPAGASDEIIAESKSLNDASLEGFLSGKKSGNAERCDQSAGRI